MNEQAIKTSYQILSFLMQYPNQSVRDALPDVKDTMNELDNPSVQSSVKSFVDYLESISDEAWVEHYIEYFDFGKITNLYVTYLKLGEQRERGLELLKLKKFYESAGFDVTDKELPDYLPLMLEFCGHVSLETGKELLGMYHANIEEIRIKLTEAQSDYRHILDALLQVMGASGLVRESA
ncbi:nitrate reductase molybdenum cofactor assembly chaperone [Oceanobacillus halotolerans]|uniref:nitrate reductase molybdenum cofactor assembly chaperone n=1 Tax=Oceanobacillus halotolerans TaxID=2663380 RepID=UPI0013D90639|nr:nitrate reductase molybdenum cofactor assembly chaperone [Oceanobacillus halotolerans]